MEDAAGRAPRYAGRVAAPCVVVLLSAPARYVQHGQALRPAFQAGQANEIEAVGSDFRHGSDFRSLRGPARSTGLRFFLPLGERRLSHRIAHSVDVCTRVVRDQVVRLDAAFGHRRRLQAALLQRHEEPIERFQALCSSPERPRARSVRYGWRAGRPAASPRTCCRPARRAPTGQQRRTGSGAVVRRALTLAHRNL